LAKKRGAKLKNVEWSNPNTLLQTLQFFYAAALWWSLLSSPKHPHTPSILFYPAREA